MLIEVASNPSSSNQSGNRPQTAKLKYIHVDAFTTKPFSGNPAAVFVTKQPLLERQMQNIGSELNLSETAFVDLIDRTTFNLRWFTPRCEVDLCGHATLAASHVLFTEGYVGQGDKIQFATKSGRLKVTKRADHICMGFPTTELESCTLDLKRTGLKGTPTEVLWAKGAIVAVLASESQVEDFCPVFSEISALDAEMFVVTAPSANEDRHFVSRVFAPKVGIDEDPVTGAAHCLIGPYWMDRFHRLSVTGEQLSSRGGVVQLEASNQPDRIIIVGRAITVLKGILLV